MDDLKSTTTTLELCHFHSYQDVPGSIIRREEARRTDGWVLCAMLARNFANVSCPTSETPPRRIQKAKNMNKKGKKSVAFTYKNVD